jgi:hypothetical protein
MKKLFWLVTFLLLASPVWGQITVPNTFVPGTVASASQVNANFEALGISALNRSGGTITGTIAVDPGVTVDGVDISELLGGNSLEIGKAILISQNPPQLVLGWDPTHVLEIGVDQDGNATIGVSAPGAKITFTDPVFFGPITASSITLGTLTCTACVGATQLAETGVGASAYGNATTVPTFTVDADGRLTAAANVAISYPAGSPTYPLGANQIPESAIIDATPSILARNNANEIITGQWRFENGIQANSFLGTTPTTTYGVNGSGSNRTYLYVDATGGTAHLGITLSGSSAFPIKWTISGSEITSMWPAIDGLYELGNSSHRFKTIHLDLPNNTTPALVVVNKGGSGADKNSALGYIVGYASLSEQIKMMGSCRVTIRGGIIINVELC